MDTMNTSRYGLMSRATRLFPPQTTLTPLRKKFSAGSLFKTLLLAAWVVPMSKGSLVGLPRRATPRVLRTDGSVFCAPSCRTVSSARRLTVLPRPRTSRSLPMGRWPYRPHRSDACNEVDKALECAQNVHSRALTIRSGARTEFPELLYAAIRFLATSQLVATRNPNASQRKINSKILQRFIHTLTV